jgi:dUTP pyrophosphatase
MEVNIKISKLIDSAVIPKYMTEGAAGFDLVATSKRVTNSYIEYGTGLAFEIPVGYEMDLYPRSSISDYTLSQCNSVGVVDSDFRGEVKIRFNRQPNIDGTKFSLFTHEYEIGDRVGQGIIREVIKAKFSEVPYDQLSLTDRGSGGFGHTDASKVKHSDESNEEQINNTNEE